MHRERGYSRMIVAGCARAVLHLHVISTAILNLEQCDLAGAPVNIAVPA